MSRRTSHKTCRPCGFDSVMLDQVLTNVLENAAKYVDGDAEIRVLARLIEGQPMLRVTVEDAGNGVPDDALPKLFEKFYRVSNGRGSGRVPARDGTGAGCCSRPGGGNGRIRDRQPQPAGWPGHRARPAHRSAGYAIAGCSAVSADILLVEDDDSAREFLAENLRGHGYTVRLGHRRFPMRSGSGKRSARTSSCSISACRTWTARA